MNYKLTDVSIEVYGKEALKWWKIHKSLILGIYKANR